MFEFKAIFVFWIKHQTLMNKSNLIQKKSNSSVNKDERNEIEITFRYLYVYSISILYQTYILLYDMKMNNLQDLLLFLFEF